MPAYPYFITVSQPDGEEITLKMKGDEHIKWMESEDGYSLLYDKNKNIVYAALDEKGDMIPSSIRASNVRMRSTEVNAELKKIPKRLQYSNEQKQLFRQVREITDKTATRSHPSLRSTSGTAKAICALIQFPDKPFTRTLEEFELLMNQIGYKSNGAYGSVRDYYYENSYGELTLEITVVGIYTASKNWKYYGENDANEQDKHPEELAKEAANFAFTDPSVNPANYDNDGDGYIDAFHVLYAGYGEEAGAETDCIWAHEYGFYPRLQFQNKYLDTYSCSPELRGKSGANITHIGVICHEMGHVFGAPDFYDTDGTDSGGEFVGTGSWDLMAGGSWNASGASPAHINMYQKIKFGWVTPIELNSSQTITNMPNSAQNPAAYLIQTDTPNEYYILENRQKKGFDAFIPGHGLLIYHVSNITQTDLNRNIINNGHPQKVYPVYAANTNALPTGTPASYGAINDAHCPFPGVSTTTTFDDSSIPTMRTWSGETVSKPITNITEMNELISFQFMRSLLGLTCYVSGRQVTLNWNIPDVQGIIGYNVYCNDKLLNFTTETAYRNTVKENGSYTYGVSIQYQNSESKQETIEVTVNLTSLEVLTESPTLVYPNPVKKGGLLTVDGSGWDEKGDLLFFDLSGRLIQKQIASPDGQYLINLPAGMYFLKVIKGQGAEIFKLTVK